MLKKRTKPNLSNVTQKVHGKKMANVGQMWPDILIPFSNDYKINEIRTRIKNV